MEDHSEKMLLEILQMARELVINEHTDRRAQLHNSWLYESEKAWVTQRMKLKYPDIPPYPTEQDVLDRAQTLLKFLVLGNDNQSIEREMALPVVLPEVVEEVIVEENHEKDKTTESVESESVVEVQDEQSGKMLSVFRKIRNKF
jgi:hypothetical protein